MLGEVVNITRKGEANNSSRVGIYGEAGFNLTPKFLLYAGLNWAQDLGFEDALLIGGRGEIKSGVTLGGEVQNINRDNQSLVAGLNVKF